MSRGEASSALGNIDKRTKILIGVLAAVVVLAGLYFFVLKSKSSSSSNSSSGATSTPVTSSTGSPKAKASPSPSAAVANDADLPTQSDPGRDPFALLPAEQARAESSASPASSSSTAAVAPAPITASPSPSASSTSSSSSASTLPDLKLVAIHGSQADVSINGKDKTISTGDEIASGLACVKVTEDAIFVTYNNKAYALTPGQTLQ